METREIYWNIQGIWVMYALAAVALAIFGYGLYRELRLVAIGRSDLRWDQSGKRVRQLAVHALLQMRSLRHRYPGSMHILISWGFAVLFMGTVVVFLQADLGVPIMHGAFYLFFQSLTLDLLGLACIAGILMALFRRYVLRPDRLERPNRLKNALGDSVILLLLLAILVTGFLLEGVRIAATGDPWSAWSPVGKLVSLALPDPATSASVLRDTHRFTWWFHMVMTLAFISYLPYSKLRHILFSPANIFLQEPGSRGELKAMDIEAAETFGTPKFGDFPRSRLLDVEACTECGRCQDACPAYRTGQPLSPKAVVLDLRKALHRPTGKTDGDYPAITAVTTEAIWSCTTCGACMEQCPVFIQHVPAIVDMRRHMVMEQAEYPDLMQEAVTSLEARGHPFRGSRYSRTDWCEGLDVRVVSEGGPAEWLYWVGCAAAFDDRAQKIARAFATLLQRAQVDFAILGEEESCTGDAARRIGNEYLYQMMAQQNIATLERYGIKKIVTACPHCMNTLKHEYRQLGANLEVYHHTELLAQLVREGRLSPGPSAIKSLTFHDSCYLARYNGVTRQPREIIAAMPGVKIEETASAREQTFCCGAGGGHMWFEEGGSIRINQERAGQLLSTGAPVIGTACPFCAIMLRDGVEATKGDRDVKLLDVAEMLEQATRPLADLEQAGAAHAGDGVLRQPNARVSEAPQA